MMRIDTLKMLSNAVRVDDEKLLYFKNAFKLHLDELCHLPRESLETSWTPTAGFIPPSPSQKGFNMFTITTLTNILNIFWLHYYHDINCTTIRERVSNYHVERFCTHLQHRHEQVCGSARPRHGPPWCCSHQDERQRARLSQVLSGGNFVKYLPVNQMGLCYVLVHQVGRMKGRYRYR